MAPPLIECDASSTTFTFSERNSRRAGVCHINGAIGVWQRLSVYPGEGRVANVSILLLPADIFPARPARAHVFVMATTTSTIGERIAHIFSSFHAILLSVPHLYVVEITGIRGGVP
jgi:hypothetical protein